MTIFFEGRARVIEFANIRDDRGVLLPIDFGLLPFRPCRSFLISEVPPRSVRGGHAHKSAQQLLLAVTGRIEVQMRFENEEALMLLDGAPAGLLIGPGIWSQQTYLDENSVLAVFASEPYDADDYITSS